MFLWIKRHFFLFITSEIHKLNLHKSRFICTSTFSSLSNFTFLWAFNSYSIKAIKIKSKPFQTSSFNLHSHITVDVNEVCSLMHWTPLPYFQKTFSSTSQAKKKKKLLFLFFSNNHILGFARVYCKCRLSMFSEMVSYHTLLFVCIFCQNQAWHLLK